MLSFITLISCDLIFNLVNLNDLTNVSKLICVGFGDFTTREKMNYFARSNHFIFKTVLWKICFYEQVILCNSSSLLSLK